MEMKFYCLESIHYDHDELYRAGLDIFSVTNEVQNYRETL